jgi:hypothetical protein
MPLEAPVMSMILSLSSVMFDPFWLRMAGRMWPRRRTER